MKSVKIFIGFVLGFIAGCIIVPSLNKFQFDYTINVGTITNLFVTLAAAFLITTFLGKKNSERRIEKDLAMDFVKTATKKLQRLSFLIAQFDNIPRLITSREQERAVAIFKDINIELDQANDCIKNYDLLDGIENPIGGIKEELLKYKQSLTLNTSVNINYGNCIAHHTTVKIGLYDLLKKINRC